MCGEKPNMGYYAGVKSIFRKAALFPSLILWKWIMVFLWNMRRKAKGPNPNSRLRIVM